MSVISVTLLHIRFIRNRSDLLTHKLTQFPSDLVKRIAVIIPEKSVIFLADIVHDWGKIGDGPDGGLVPSCDKPLSGPAPIWIYVSKWRH